MLVYFDAGGKERQLQIFRRKLLPMLEKLDYFPLNESEIFIDESNQLHIGILSLGDYRLISSFELCESENAIYYDCNGKTYSFWYCDS